MHNFKPGDLALFIGECFAGLMTGSVVKLEEFIQAGTIRQMPENSDRSHFYAPCDCWVVSNEGIDTYITGEKMLMPLRGDFAPERQKSQELPA